VAKTAGVDKLIRWLRRPIANTVMAGSAKQSIDDQQHR